MPEERSKMGRQGIALVAAALPLMIAGVVAGRSDSSAFGLSNDFWAGFLIGTGLVAMVAGIAALMIRRSSK